MDGIVTEGHGVMDESFLTGEPFQMSKTPGSQVISGAINLYLLGPPFDGAPLGCAVKAMLMVLAMFVVPFLMTTPVEAVWVMWWILLIADLLSVAAHWDVQRRLKRFEAAAAVQNDKQ